MWFQEHLISKFADVSAYEYPGERWFFYARSMGRSQTLNIEYGSNYVRIHSCASELFAMGIGVYSIILTFDLHLHGNNVELHLYGYEPMYVTCNR